MSKPAKDTSNGGGKYTNSPKSSTGTRGPGAFSGLMSGALEATIVAVLNSGDAISFSATRDGGAVCITMLSDGAVDKLYAASVDDLTELLESVREVAEG